MKRILSLILAVVWMAGLVLAVSPAPAASGEKLVALTFDDGPGPYTDRLLDGLKARGVAVTFFMVGTNVRNYPETVARVYREGHQVANHSYDHPDLTGLSDSGVQSQIQKTNELLDKACGRGATYLVRAPYGSTNARVRSLVGAPLVYWSVDPQDWKYRNAETVKNHIVDDAFDGAIILVHDIHSTSVDGALAAIDILQNRGYEFVTVWELFRRRGQSMENGVQYYSCKPNGTDLGPVEAPVISAQPEGSQLRVTMTAQSGAAIYYTTGDSQLNQESSRYTGSFLVSPPCTIRAVAAFDLNGSRSPVVEKALTQIPAQTPGLQVEGGVLTLENRTPGATVYYTLDGTPAGVQSAVYTGPVTLSPGTVISACAGGGNFLPSGQVRATYSHRGNFFRDVFPTQWYYDEVDRATSAGYMQGMGDGRFYPDRNVTRGQLVTMLYRISGEAVSEQELAALPFQDVKSGRYYTEATAWAYARGIVKGYETGAFLPERQVSRQEMSQMVYGYLSYRRVLLPDGTSAVQQYRDAGQIAPWALEAVGQMTAGGLLQGDKTGTFRPLDGSTRAQAATVLMRVADLLRGALVA